jgi:hypothetical protein
MFVRPQWLTRDSDGFLTSTGDTVAASGQIPSQIYALFNLQELFLAF